MDRTSAETELTPVRWRVLHEYYPRYGVVAGGVYIDACEQRDGSVKYAVRMREHWDLNKSGSWDYAPLPSSRDEEYLTSHRWETLEGAYEAVQVPLNDIRAAAKTESADHG